MCTQNSLLYISLRGSSDYVYTFLMILTSHAEIVIEKSSWKRDLIITQVRRTQPCCSRSTAINSLAPSGWQERRDVRRARTALTTRANSRRDVKLNGPIDPCLLICSDRHPHLRTDAADWSPIMPPRHRKLWHSSLLLSHSRAILRETDLRRLLRSRTFHPVAVSACARASVLNRASVCTYHAQTNVTASASQLTNPRSTACASVTRAYARERERERERVRKRERESVFSSSR